MTYLIEYEIIVDDIFYNTRPEIDEFKYSRSKNQMIELNIFNLKKQDLPVGVPVLKYKNGLYYRPNNCGYTNSLLEAGLYNRDEAIKYCFDGESNGSCGVYAMPLSMAIEQGFWSKKKIKEHLERLNVIEKFAAVDDYKTIIF